MPKELAALLEPRAVRGRRRGRGPSGLWRLPRDAPAAPPAVCHGGRDIREGPLGRARPLAEKPRTMVAVAGGVMLDYNPAGVPTEFGPCA